MGKVEDIYRAIRNNKIVAIHYVRPSDEELTEGVARIRQRLTAVGQPQTKKIEVRNRLLAPKFWIPAAALAAAAVLLVVLQLPRPHTEEHLLRHAGQPLRLNTAYQIRQNETVAVENRFFLRALSNIELSAKYDADGNTHIYVAEGIALISRFDMTFGSVVHTKNREYRLTGTRFLLNTSGNADFVFMFEGSLQIHGGDRDATLSAEGASTLSTRGLTNDISKMGLSELLKSRADLQKLLRENSLLEKTVPAAKNQLHFGQSAARFKNGDCVTYYRNNEKRRGQIHARDASGYVISGASGLEPGRWRDGDIFAAECE